MSIQFWVSLLLVGIAAIGTAFLTLLLAFIFQSLTFLIVFAVLSSLGGLLCYFGLSGLTKQAGSPPAKAGG